MGYSLESRESSGRLMKFELSELRNTIRGGSWKRTRCGDVMQPQLSWQKFLPLMP
jgi:hypothetical protein